MEGGEGSYVRVPSPQPFRYDLAFASLPEAALLLDEQGRVTAVNAAAESLLGAGAASGARGEDVAVALPWLACAVDRILEGGADAAGLEAEASTAQGPRRLAAKLRALREGGRLAGAVVTLEDRTGRRALEAHERSAEHLAALGTLAAGLAHEVNNPLACVVAGISFVESEHGRVAPRLPEGELTEAKLALEEARESALRVGRIVRSLQDFGYPSAPLVGEVDLGEALQRAVQLAEHDVRSRARLVAELEGRPRVRASEPLLVELFLALFASAARGHPSGHAVRVALRTERGEACVIVSETGLPVANGPAARDGREPLDPRGLGLTMTQGIVTALGGRLELEPAPGGGTTATVRLPLAA